jgi:hypothetical protein
MAQLPGKTLTVHLDTCIIGPAGMMWVARTEVKVDGNAERILERRKGMTGDQS